MWKSLLAAGLLVVGTATSAPFSKDALTEDFDYSFFGGLFGNGAHEFIDNLVDTTPNTKNALKMAAILRNSLESDALEDFNQFFGFIIKYGKEYKSQAEVAERFRKFQDSLASIETNSRENPELEFAVNKYDDLSEEEFFSGRLGTYAKKTKKFDAYVPKTAPDNVPDSWDWRDHNGVTPVKDQQHCGSCYAFSVVGTIESQYLVHKKTELDLSEEDLVACTYLNDTEYHNNGCHGGNFEDSFAFAQEKGLCTEKDWPYDLDDMDTPIPQCTKKPVAAKIKEITSVSDEDDMKVSLYENGPLLAEIQAGGNLFRDYHSGVMDPPTPPDGWNINHGVVIIGYGTTENGTDYWTIKNSWGKGWGDHGYFKIRRGTDCLGVTSGVFAVSV
ncbi:unnamed protein product [Bursaphelenchus xylophilus]|nr:unnamed protein product [Bursaphelenchus xylophilus]CAG9122240.1 unnamed protein product [Bursaphelenchus xylophilus]